MLGLFFDSSMKEVQSSKTSVNFYQTTRRNILENNNVHNEHSKNLKIHALKLILSYAIICKNLRLSNKISATY